MARITGDQVNAAFGAFRLGYGIGRDMRAVMNERAERIAWEEDRPKVEAQLRKLMEPINLLEEKLQAAETAEERTKLMQQRTALQNRFAMGAMEIAARLGSSTNKQARQYGAAVQQQITMGMEAEFKRQGLALQQQGLELQQQAQKGDQEWRQTQGQWRQDDLNREASQRSEDLRWRGEQERLQADDRKRDDERADRMLGLEERRVAVDEQKAQRGPITDPGERARAAVAIAGALQEGALGEKQATLLFGQLGIPAEQRDPELWTSALEKKRKVFQTKLEQELERPSPNQARIDDLRQVLADIDTEDDAMTDARLAAEKNRGKPGLLEEWLTPDAPPEGETEAERMRREPTFGAY